MPLTRSDTRLTEEMIQTYTDAGYWGRETLWDLIERNAAEYPDKEAFVDARRRVTWSELEQASKRLALKLVDLGIGTGDVVAVQLPNWVDFLFAMAAINSVGAVICSYGTEYRPREVEFILRFSHAVAAVVPDHYGGFDFLGMINEMRSGLPELRHVFVVADGPVTEEALHFRSFTEGPEPDAADYSLLESRRPGSNDLMRILFTSGSTGDPKGVLHSYNTTLFTTAEENKDWGLTSDSALLLFLPLGLNWGMVHFIQTCQAVAKLVLMEKFEAARVFETIEREKVSFFGNAPTGLIPLLGDALSAQYDLSSLQLIVTAGASCPIDLIRQTNERLGAPVVEMYGMTEAGYISATKRDDSVEEVIGTVGPIFPWFQPRLLDHEDRDVQPGEEGELVLTGPTVCLGYYNNPDRNSESWTSDGWFRTGDIGVIDEHGRLRLVGRKKDMLIHGGANVWPRELEEILFTHPKIADAGVIGVPDSYFGENACACVVLRPGESLTLEEVVEFMRDKVAKYKLPQQLVVMDALPYTSTGKLQKHLLRQHVVAPQRGNSLE